MRRYSSTNSGSNPSSQSIDGQMNDIGRSALTSGASSRATGPDYPLWTNANLRSLPTPLPARREAHDGADQVFLGRERQRVHPAALEGLVQCSFAPPRRLLEAPAELAVVRVHVELLAGLRVLHDDRADVRQFRLARVPQADGEDFVPPVQQGQRPLPPRRADEVGDDE